MDLKKEVKEIIKWAEESDENKKKAINMATAMIAMLNANDKDFSDEHLENIVGGLKEGGVVITKQQHTICISSSCI
jgi:hypothetical protein